MGLRAHKRCCWWFWLHLEVLNKKPPCTLTSVCALLLWEEEFWEGALVFLTCPLSLSASAVWYTFQGLESDRKIHPSIFTGAPEGIRTSRSARYQRYVHHVRTAHTYMYTLDRQTLQRHTHGRYIPSRQARCLNSACMCLNAPSDWKFGASPHLLWS